MTEIYRYTIIRFRPFSETGEFANIGVVAANIQTGETGYRLAPNRFVRIRNFFDSTGYSAYRSAITYLRKELERLSREVPLVSINLHHDAFADITRNKESSVIFGDVRVVKSREPFEELLDSLYGRYIGRNFIGSENAESLLTKRLRTNLRANGIRHFKALRIDDDVVPVVFPLAFQDESVHAIKPLAFSQKSALHIFDYGSSWKNRLLYLLERDKIKAGNILLAVQGPEEMERSHQEAFELAEQELMELPVEIVRTDLRGNLDERVISFAKRFPDTTRFLH